MSHDPTIYFEVSRLLRHFDRHKEPTSDFIASVTAELSDINPNMIRDAVSEVIRTEPALTNPVYQVRAAAAFLRGRVPSSDPLATFTPEERAKWRARNPAFGGSVLDLLETRINLPARRPIE